MTLKSIVNLIGDDIETIDRSAEILLNAFKDIGLAVNTGKTKYMEEGLRRGMTVNYHFAVSSNPYEKVKTFQ